MCLPTDSTFICTADRRVAIITAYHSSCAGISDIIRLLVHHCVTVSTSVLDTVCYIPLHSLYAPCAYVDSIY